MTDEVYRNISVKAKVLYALMLERMVVSEMNNWKDKLDETYIYCTLQEMHAALLRGDYVDTAFTSGA